MRLVLIQLNSMRSRLSARAAPKYTGRAPHDTDTQVQGLGFTRKYTVRVRIDARTFTGRARIDVKGMLGNYQGLEVTFRRIGCNADLH